MIQTVRAAGEPAGGRGRRRRHRRALRAPSGGDLKREGPRIASWRARRGRAGCSCAGRRASLCVNARSVLVYDDHQAYMPAANSISRLVIRPVPSSPGRRGDERVDFRVWDVPGQDGRPGRGEAPLTIRGGRVARRPRCARRAQHRRSPHRTELFPRSRGAALSRGRPSKSRPATFSKASTPS